jgi:hypothetical protein
MSAWTHVLCPACYADAEPGRAPLRVVNAPAEACCACGANTVDLISYRADPRRFGCHGAHADDD